jgi:hypothetical protein
MPNFRQPDKSVSRAFVQNGVYVGNVTRTDEASQQIYVEIPRYVAGFEFGPLNVACSDLPVVGDSVACLFLENKQEDVMILGVIKNADSDVTVTPIVATSVTRPASPKVGTIVYETDTEDIYVWSGTEWLTFFEVNLPATIYADLQGTAASATFASSVADNSVVLGNDTMGNYVAGVTGGTGVTVTGSGSEGATPSIAIGQSVSASATPSFSRITSTVAIGTAPFTVTSNTVVTNLNADLLDGQEGSYYRDAGNINAGTLAIARGGTNSTATPTDGGIAYGDGSGLAYTALGTSGQVLQSNGTSAPTWVGGAWTSWTPAITATTTNPSLGSGGFLNASGAYIQIGKTVMGWALIIAGNTSVTAGSGTYQLSFPVAPLAAVFNQQLGTVNYAAQSPHFGIIQISGADNTKATMVISNAAVTAATGPLAANVQLRYHFTYETA